MGGAILTPVLGKTLQALKVKKLGLDEQAPDISKLKEKDFIQVKLPGSEDVTVIKGSKKSSTKNKR